MSTDNNCVLIEHAWHLSGIVMGSVSMHVSGCLLLSYWQEVEAALDIKGE